MVEQQEERVRITARRRGMALARVVQSGEAGLYELTVPAANARIYPQGAGCVGASLHEIEEWLSCPWE